MTFGSGYAEAKRNAPNRAVEGVSRGHSSTLLLIYSIAQFSAPALIIYLRSLSQFAVQVIPTCPN